MKLSVKVKIEQKMNNKQLLSLKLLQLSSEKLDEYLRESALSNPMIDYPDSYVYSESGYSFLSNSRNALTQSQWSDFPQKESYPDLQTFLREQLIHLHFTSQEERALDVILSSLDEKGFLSADISILAQQANADIPSFLSILSKVQGCDPPGIAARDLSESFQIQLHLLGIEDKTLHQIVKFYLSDLLMNRLPKLSEMLHISINTLSDYREQVLALNPWPGTGYTTASPQYIVPDILIENRNNIPCIFIYTSINQLFRINAEYLSLYKSTQDQEVKGYLKEQLQQAQWLKTCLQRREQTLLKIGNVILRQQYNYFTNQTTELQPLSLSDIAKECDLHISTVSRAIQNKYIHCDRGTIPISTFIIRGRTIERNNTCTSVSINSLNMLIKKIIQVEDKAHPFSDQKIMEILSQKGYSIPRRTVTYYRNQAGIPNSTLRKKYKGA